MKRISSTLSVVLTSYNHQEFIEKTLISIKSQTFQDFELIVIDDGSIDDSVKIIKNNLGEGRLLLQKNLGVIDARNKGIERSNGEFICFVDSDDLLVENRFKKQVEMLQRDPSLGLIYSDAFIINAKDEIIGKFHDVYPVRKGPVAEMLFRYYCFIPMITVMLRKKVFKESGGFEKSGPHCDYIKWMEVALKNNVGYSEDALGYWRRHGRNVSVQLNPEEKYKLQRKAFEHILDKYPEFRKELKGRVRKKFAVFDFLTGFFLAANGDVLKAREFYLKAIKQDPLQVQYLCSFLLVLLPFKDFIVKIHGLIKQKKLPW